MGKGDKTRVWEDKWLILSEEGRIKSSKPRNCDIVFVKDLIQNHRWKRELLENLFCKDDVEQIIQIPISLAGR